MSDRIETVILKNLVFNESFCRKALPFLKPEYFSENHEKLVFEHVRDFVVKYNSLPTNESLVIQLSDDKTITKTEFDKSSDLLATFIPAEFIPVDDAWLIDKTESFCQEKAIYHAVLSSIHILDDKDHKQEKGAIPKMLSDALAVSFDPNIGHSYTEDAEKRYEAYHTKEVKIPFDLEYFNKITNGGLSRKTLNIILAGTAVGKTLCLVHFAASHLMAGKNVLYITLEMSEEKIAERIDANLLNVPLLDLVDLSKDVYEKKVKSVKEKTVGKLIIKEYPTASASTTHFRHLLHELNLKKSFVPDVIIVDYLNIATSSRIKAGSVVNSYTYIKSIAEELRGLAVEYNVPILSATQLNRQGYTSTDVGLEDTSESFGLPSTADFMFALISTEELEKLGQLLVKQLKNRYNDISANRRFLVGVDRPRMRLFDLDDSVQTANLHDHVNGKKSSKTESKEDEGPVFDKTNFGHGLKQEKSKFDDIMF
jgi:replicative DNA helicase